MEDAPANVQPQQSEKSSKRKKFMKSLHRQKPLEGLREAADKQGLDKTLTAQHLIMLGIGSVVGAGIFVLTGQAAAKYAGPALSLSFVISAVACFFTGMCYAELASTIPIAGSAYSYVYVSSGEIYAWGVGLCLTFEYLFSAAAVAVGWGAALQDLLWEFGVKIPEAVASSPFAVNQTTGELQLTGSVVNLPSMFIIGSLAIILCFGIKESAKFNNVAVALKISVLVAFVGYGIYFAFRYTDKLKYNLEPFIPPNTGQFGHYGISGIFRGAGAIFFAYIGFDAVCAVAQECEEPERDLPRGLLGTLTVCTILYISVTLSLTGIMKYTLLDVDAPVIDALLYVDAPVVFRFLVEIATIAGLTSVCLVSLMSMPRVVFAAASDGLLPEWLAFVHPRFKTPLHATYVTGICCCFITGTFPLDFLGELVSFGTLLAFSMVCVGVLRMRKQYPLDKYPRPFETPCFPYVPLGGIFICLIQLFSLPYQTWRNCLTLLSAGMLVFFLYGRKHSNLHKREAHLHRQQLEDRIQLGEEGGEFEEMQEKRPEDFTLPESPRHAECAVELNELSSPRTESRNF